MTMMTNDPDITFQGQRVKKYIQCLNTKPKVSKFPNVKKSFEGCDLESHLVVIKMEVTQK